MIMYLRIPTLLPVFLSTSSAYVDVLFPILHKHKCTIYNTTLASVHYWYSCVATAKDCQELHYIRQTRTLLMQHPCLCVDGLCTVNDLLV